MLLSAALLSGQAALGWLAADHGWGFTPFLAVHAGAWLVVIGCFEAGRYDGQGGVGKSA